MRPVSSSTTSRSVSYAEESPLSPREALLSPRALTIDRTKLPQPFDCLKQGLLRRKEKGQGWQVRWFVLYHNALFAYKPGAPEPKADALPQLVVPLSAIGHERRHAMRVVIQRVGQASDDEDERASVLLESDLGHAVLLQAVLDEEDTEPLQVWLSALLQQAIRVERALLRARSARIIYDHLSRSRSRIAPSPLQSAPQPLSKQSHWLLARPTRNADSAPKKAESRRLSERSTAKRLASASTGAQGSDAILARSTPSLSSPNISAAAKTRAANGSVSARSSPLLPRSSALVPIADDTKERERKDSKESKDSRESKESKESKEIKESKESKEGKGEGEADEARNLSLADFLQEEPPSPRRRAFTFGTPPSQRQLQISAPTQPTLVTSASVDAVSPRLARKTARRSLAIAEAPTLAAETVASSSSDDEDAPTDALPPRVRTLFESYGPALDYVTLPKLPDLPPTANDSGDEKDKDKDKNKGKGKEKASASSGAELQSDSGGGSYAPSILPVSLHVSSLLASSNANVTTANTSATAPSGSDLSSSRLNLVLPSSVTRAPSLSLPLSSSGGGTVSSPASSTSSLLASSPSTPLSASSSLRSPLSLSSPSLALSGSLSPLAGSAANDDEFDWFTVRPWARYLALDAANANANVNANVTISPASSSSSVPSVNSSSSSVPNLSASPSSPRSSSHWSADDGDMSSLVRLQVRHAESRAVLGRLLAALSEADAFFDLVQQMSARAESYQHKDLLALVARCLRPHLLLTTAASSSAAGSYVNPYAQIEELAKELSRHAALVRQRFRDEEFAALLAQGAAYYTAYVAEAKLHPYGAAGLAPPIALCGSGLVSTRVLRPRDANRVLGARMNKYGLRDVTSLRGVHFKREPEAPGQEFAVDALYQLLVGEGTTPSELLRIDLGKRAFTVQASASVLGVNLKRVLEERPDLLRADEAALSTTNYSAHFVMGLLTDPNDHKPENFVCRLRHAERRLEIVGVDNDLAFADAIGVMLEEVSADGSTVRPVPPRAARRRKTQAALAAEDEGTWTLRRRYFVNVRNVLYLLPHADERIDEALKRRLLALEPALLLLAWLRALHRQNAQYVGSAQWSAPELEKLQLPLRLRAGTAATVYQKLQFIQDFLTLRPLATHRELLEALQPELSHYYAAIQRRHPHALQEQFEALFRGPYFDELPELDEVRLPDEREDGEGEGDGEGSDEAERRVRLKDFMDAREYADDPLAFVKERRQTPLEAMAEFLAEIDFSECARGVQVEAVALVCGLPLRSCTLVGCDALDDAHLHALLDAAPNLHALELVRCHGLTDLALDLLHARRQHLTRALLVDCRGITRAHAARFADDAVIRVLEASDAPQGQSQAHARQRSYARDTSLSLAESAQGYGLTSQRPRIARAPQLAALSEAARSKGSQLRDALDLDLEHTHSLARKRSQRSSVAAIALTSANANANDIANAASAPSSAATERRAAQRNDSFAPLRSSNARRSMVVTPERTRELKRTEAADEGDEVSRLRAQLDEERRRNEALVAELERLRASSSAPIAALPLAASSVSSSSSASSSQSIALTGRKASSKDLSAKSTTTLVARPPRPSAPPPMSSSSSGTQ